MSGIYGRMFLLIVCLGFVPEVAQQVEVCRWHPLPRGSIGGFAWGYNNSLLIIIQQREAQHHDNKK